METSKKVEAVVVAVAEVVVVVVVIVVEVVVVVVAVAAAVKKKSQVKRTEMLFQPAHLQHLYVIGGSSSAPCGKQHTATQHTIVPRIVASLAPIEVCSAETHTAADCELATRAPLCLG